MQTQSLLATARRLAWVTALSVTLSACVTNPDFSSAPTTTKGAKSPVELAMDEVHSKLDALTAADASRRTALTDQNKRLELLQQEITSLRGELDQTRHGAQQLGQHVAELRNYIARAYGMPMQSSPSVDFAQPPAEQGAQVGFNQPGMGLVGMQQNQESARQAQATMEQPGMNPNAAMQPGMEPMAQSNLGNGTLQPQGMGGAVMQPPPLLPQQPGMGQPTMGMLGQNTQQALTAAQPPAPKVLPQATNAKEAYDQAKLYVTSGQYDRAQELFDGFLKQYGSDPLADNAQYWLGEMHYVQRNFRSALVEFNNVLVKWPNSGKVPDSLLKIGFSFYELEDYENARRALEQLVQNYPNANAVPLAMQRLKRIEQVKANIH
ncbi:Tetratricopeptide TPR_2 repeat protein [Magnetococcus marinus MC-1]|uniref:Cell division coordinator CpoB n=2 Tax=Magnetococcus TaxID=162171 RepID=A0L4U7_MAGMM|nr:Tetratricopeptide TPR_2 repeat protein [Magnetococcus marinus MC-1]